MAIFREVMNRRRLLFTLAGVGSTALIVGLVSSGNGENAESESEAQDNTTDEGATGPEEAKVEATEVSTFPLNLSSAGDQLAFSPSELVAPVNAQIELTFQNVSTIFSHNWLLFDGDEVALHHFLEAAALAGPEKDYLPEDMSNVIAHTPLVSRGDSATITFDAPPAGTYTFVCTFPGHCLAGMQGTLTITA